MRAGIGYDIHRLVKGRKLVLGGTQVPFEKGLLGHSDGDVLHHAVVDAALGAAGLGDIGEHFSDGDARNKDLESAVFVQKTAALLARKNFYVAQIDAVLVLERPKLSRYKEKIRKNLSKAWGLDTGAVNVKAKTNEGLDAVGQGKAIACHAIVVLRSLKKEKK